MGNPKELFNGTANDAGLRTEGIITAMIEWWIDVKNGLANLEAVADKCSFEAILIKCADEVTKILFEKYDYKTAFLTAWKQDPNNVYFYDMILPIGHKNHDVNLAFFNQIVDQRLPYAVAHRLFTTWWPKHDKRIKKERENYKRVQRIMES